MENLSRQLVFIKLNQECQQLQLRNNNNNNNGIEWKMSVILDNRMYFEPQTLVYIDNTFD